MRKGIVTAALALVLCLALASPAVAATRIKGTVRNISTGKAIKGAVVKYGKSSAKTNKYGRYTLKVKAGKRLLTVKAKGYLTTSRVVRAVKNRIRYADWKLNRTYPAKPVTPRAVTILAWNDLGMHCDQDSYQYFMVLPPYNTLHAQVFSGGDLRTGYTVEYRFPKKTDSTLHTDFWQYASSFGYTLAPNVGLAGKGLSGTMVKDAKGLGYVAEGIPITPYDDDGTWDPYGTAIITVKNGTTVLGEQEVVAPVSTEMNCSTCHGANFAVSILTLHDNANGTSLLADANAGHPHACAECHADNALGRAGQPGIPSLSVAMHRRHDGKVPNTMEGCYSCHPGPKTQCNRGVMVRAGKTCPDCHGTMTQVWQSAVNGRQPWLNEPTCASCHGSKYGENSGKLYRDSVLKATYHEMDNKIYCEACHNSTHAEYVSNNAADAVVPKAYQGDSYWIYNCKVCHNSAGGSGGDDDDDEGDADEGDSITYRGQSIHR